MRGVRLKLPPRRAPSQEACVVQANCKLGTSSEKEKAERKTKTERGAKPRHRQGEVFAFRFLLAGLASWDDLGLTNRSIDRLLLWSGWESISV